MKIVINAYSARIGGGQTYLINLLRNLPDDPAFKISIFAPDSLDIPNDARIDRLRTFFPTTNPILRALWERFVLPITLARLKADVLFCPGGLINTRPLHSCQTVTMFRNMLPFDKAWRARLPLGMRRVRNWLLEREMLRSMKNADLTIFISEYAKSVIESLIPVKNSRTIPHGISDGFRVSGKSLPRPEQVGDGKYIVYVSRFDVYKHHLEVVAAYMQLPDAFKNKYRLLLVGENDMPEGNKVRQLLEQSGLTNNVILAGPIGHHLLPGTYKNAALILFASSCENCPNILLESMASGRPVVSSSVMPMPEFGGTAVLYFDPRNPDELAEQIGKVLSDPDLSESLGRSAAAKSADYRWESTAAATWTAIRSLVPAKKAKVY